MLKAMREAKQKTSWTANNAEFEDALNELHRGDSERSRRS